MRLVLVFGRDDPARVRFAVSPLWETMSALRVLREPHRCSYHLPWLDLVRPDLDRMDLRPLLVLSPHAGWTPDFLTPAPGGPGTDIADQLAQVRATAPEQVAREVQRSLTERSGEPAPEAAWRLLEDPAATRGVLADLLEQCWQLLIAPHWPRLRDLLQADVLYRTRRLGDYGLDRMLDDLDPRAHWTGHSILIDGPAAGRHRLGGAGLLLMPSVFVWPDLAAVIDPPARPALAYPARGIAELWQPAPTRHSPALARLLGRTRAALLESLAEPASTHTLARRHGLAPSTVSEHLTALHHTRLITRRRHRHAVLYQQTPLGAELANGGHQPRRTAMSKAPGKQRPPPQLAMNNRAHLDVHPVPTCTSPCSAIELPSVQAVGERNVPRLEPRVLERPGGLLAAAERADRVGAGDGLSEPVHHRILDGQRRAGDDRQGRAVGKAGGDLPGPAGGGDVYPRGGTVGPRSVTVTGPSGSGIRPVALYRRTL